MLALSAPASAAEQTITYNFDIPAQDVSSALIAYGRASHQQLVFDGATVRNRMSSSLVGDYAADAGLVKLLEGTGLRAEFAGSGAVRIVDAQAPQGGSAAGGGATVEALIVTAQKREENIQDVPIAISAFSSKELEQQKIEGGFDLLKAIPNVTFSKNNFTSYNFSIRGIGTKAVSATTDPGVAVSFNNVALLQNRLFEQEYFDIERVEVLRGPQGTLYGRNATSGVVNVITAKPDMNDFDGWIKGEVGNYHAKRLSAMVNVPLIEDKLAIRIAGAMTDRQGYDFNAGTGNSINGRDLWSARLTLAFNPNDRIHANLIWERFNEDDDRSRTGKQLCYRDPGPTMVGETPVHSQESAFLIYNEVRQSLMSQGCKPGSLYDARAFGTPNGLSLPFFPASSFASDYGATGPFDPELGYSPGVVNFLSDPYGGMMQSPDLRVIDSIKDPKYVAKADVVQLNLDFDVTDQLTVYSQTVYNKDVTYSSQDYNRFNTLDIFNDTSNWTGFGAAFRSVAPGGYFNDPQLGRSRKMVGYDIATAKGKQFGQELRLQSDFDGALNFSLGANYTRFNTVVDYYVFYNLITALASLPPFNDAYNQGANPIESCLGLSLEGYRDDYCPYIDPNPLESINGDGHNYFRSKNPYKLSSTAAFGELYWNISDEVKITAGLRYTNDRKTFTPVPSQVLLAPGPIAGGAAPRGYPELPPIKQEWGEWTGRLGVDWKPELTFTDDTMMYAFYSRGYKGGGANPPVPGFGTASLQDYFPLVVPQMTQFLEFFGHPELVPSVIERFTSPILHLSGVEYERTFKPEFVDAFEVGAKNTLLDGALTLNSDFFFYNYDDYQVSQIRDRTAVNENFDAKIWGIEVQSTFAPSRDLQIIANIGYLDTEIGNGERSIDIMDRTAGNPDFIVMKPWVQLPSNCIVPVNIAEIWLQNNTGVPPSLCGGSGNLIDFFNFLTVIQSDAFVIDPLTGEIYDPAYYNGENGTIDIHGGAGIAKNLGGNELPNAPHWTMNIGAQYGHDILDGSWRLTLRGDAYWQSQSWARVYNSDPYDKLHGWYNVNLSLWIERPDDDLKIEIYAKNLLDKTPITDAFLNSDDTALTTNVFVLDPRLIGLSIKKGF